MARRYSLEFQAEGLIEKESGKNQTESVTRQKSKAARGGIPHPKKRRPA
jgi:hypothetical protein